MEPADHQGELSLDPSILYSVYEYALSIAATFGCAYLERVKNFEKLGLEEQIKKQRITAICISQAVLGSFILAIVASISFIKLFWVFGALLAYFLFTLENMRPNDDLMYYMRCSTYLIAYPIMLFEFMPKDPLDTISSNLRRKVAKNLDLFTDVVWDKVFGMALMLLNHLSISTITTSMEQVFQVSDVTLINKKMALDLM